MLSRRDVMGKLAAGTAAVWVAGVARASVGSTGQAENALGNTGNGDQPHAAGAPVPDAFPFGPDVVDAGPPETLSAPVPWELVHPLALGAAVAPGWRVAGLSGVVKGSCVVTLENERGRAHRVHVCANAGRPQGLVYTKRLDLLVMNGGQGDLPTDEGFAQAVAALAHVLAANEADGRNVAVVSALLPHAERVERFAAAASLR